MKLSLIDVSIKPYGGDRKQALKNTVETAKVIEELGFRRIWLGEHHNFANTVGRTPEVLIAAVAENTNKIHVGSGSILLNHYSPYKIAEVFSTLCELYPGRIDLGIGRASVGKLADFALQQNRTAYQQINDSKEQILELLAWLTNDFPENHPFKNNVKVDNDGGLPNIFLLGSSSWSAETAAELGLAYVFAAFINSRAMHEAAQNYQNNFQINDKIYSPKSPKISLSLSVHVHDTNELALEFSAPMQYVYKQVQSGIVPDRYVSENEAINLLNGSAFMERLSNPFDPPKFLIGSAEIVAKEIRQIQQAFGTEEIFFQILTANHTQRLKSLELLSKHLPD